MRRLRYLLMLLLALHALGMAGLDVTRNYVETGGGIFGDACTGDGVQKYEYNGKNLDCAHGLDTYDYGARMYDAALPVWDRPDPLAHKYYHVSPYAYCANNPLMFFDSDGKLLLYANGVSKSFKKDFVIAVKFLNSHGCASMLKELNNSKNIYYISESKSGKNSFDFKNNTIEWQSRIGLRTNEYHYLSPTTLLNHEISHALEYDKDPKSYSENINRYDDTHPDNMYYSPEEKRVITNAEQKTASALGEINDGEVTRTDHFGKHILMQSTISNKPVKKDEEKGVIIIPKH